MTILHLEDDRTHAEFVHALLEAEWPGCDIIVADHEAAFIAALQRGGIDVILSDFTLPQFDGLAALRQARVAAPDVPFIFLSGNIGEERAIEALRCGASDYVLKDRAKRLVPAIHRALRDAAEQRRGRALEAERERLAATLDASPDFVALASAAGRVHYLNAAAQRRLGVASDWATAELQLVDFFPPAVAGHVRDEYVAEALRHGTWTGESLLFAQGVEVPVAATITAHRGAGGSVEYLSISLRDLTDARRAESLVHGQNQVLEMIAGGEPVNETLAALLRFLEGQAPEMLCSVQRVDEDGQRLRHCAAPRLPAAYIAALDPLPIGPDRGSCGTAAFTRTSVVAADIGTDPRWFGYRELALAHGLRACWSTPVFDVNHRLLGTVGGYLRQPGEPEPRLRQLTDIAAHIAAICLSRHRVEHQLRAQAEILNKASDTIVVLDQADRVTFWNHGAERTFGWAAGDTLGRSSTEVFATAAPEEFAPARAAAAQGEEWRGELHIPDRAGRVHAMETRITPIRDDAGQPAGWLAIATDATDRKRIEEQFFRAQRLESIGMLAAGIAHDLNNVLAPILLAAPMLRDHASDPADVRIISTLERSAERGAGLVRQILGFAHGADGAHRLLQPKHLLRDMAVFIEETFPKSIHLEHVIPSDLWLVNGNPTQLHQVLLNLCVNARDAMADGGTLTLRAENLVVDEVAGAALEGGRSGPFVVIHVEDSGTGIAPEVLARIWDPFFTTKAAGKGTGLGLSTVRGIVESHAGFVTVHSLVGRGTTFRVHLPAAEAGAVSPTDQTPVAVAARGTGELVLVVDDEPGIRNMAAAILARHGYRVLTAADGAEAVALFAPRSREIRVLITDISMPNLDGAALAGVVLRINPHVKVVAVSGLSPENAASPAPPPFGDAYLPKPFRPEVLLTTVHELLRAPANPPP
jgi:PAS domain S-box-containing protein